MMKNVFLSALSLLLLWHGSTLAQEKNHILNESFKLLESDDVTTQIEGLKKLWENVNVKDNNILLLSTSFEKSSEVILTTINSFFELDKFLIKGNTSVSMLYYRLMVDVVDKTTDAAIQLKKEDLSHAGLSIAIELLEKVKSSALKVKKGEAAFERDSVVFEKEDHAWHVVASLLLIASRNGNKLHVLDFGGSLGSQYFQNKRFFEHLSEFSWSVVEQQNFVECGKGDAPQK